MRGTVDLDLSVVRGGGVYFLSLHFRFLFYHMTLSDGET